MVLRSATKSTGQAPVLSQQATTIRTPVVVKTQHPCRVISAEAKSIQNLPSTKHRIAGVLEVVGGGSHYAEVREGVLVLHSEPCPTSQAKWKVPLRGLSLLQAKPVGFAFALASPTESSPLTFQVGTEYEYERWVKCLAVELMRQTPLDRVKFLDILGITGSLRRSRSAECVSSRTTSPRSTFDNVNVDCNGRLAPPTNENYSPQHGYICLKEEDNCCRLNTDCYNGNGYKADCYLDTDCYKHEVKCLNDSAECYKLGLDCVDSPPPPDLTSPPGQPSSLVYRKRNQQLPDVVRDLPPCSRRSRSRKKELRLPKIRGQSLDPVSVMYDRAQPQVTELLLKCQRSDVYVPVREKRLLFESLWRRDGQVVCRSQSLHDLSQEPLEQRPVVARYTADKTSHPNTMGVSLENMVEGEESRQRRPLQISDKLSHYTSPYGNTYRR